MKMIVVITHNLNPELAKYLESVKSVNSAEISAAGIILNITDSEAIPSDVRSFGRRIEEINRIIDLVGHHEIAKAILSGKYYSKDDGIKPRQKNLVDRLNDAAGRELDESEISRILDIVSLRLRIRVRDGQKNSFNSVLNQLREAVSKITI